MARRRHPDSPPSAHARHNPTPRRCARLVAAPLTPAVRTQELGDLLHDIDVNGNGVIDFEEFVVLMQTLTWVRGNSLALGGATGAASMLLPLSSASPQRGRAPEQRVSLSPLAPASQRNGWRRGGCPA